MKVLFIDFDLPQFLRDAEHPVGGWCIQLNLMLRELSRHGHRAGVLTWKSANAYVGPQDVCDLVETYDPSEGIPKLRFFARQAPAVLRMARSYAPDILFQSCAGIQTGLMAFAARRLGIPFVHRIASNIDADGGFRAHVPPSGRTPFRFGLRKADLIICQNDYQRDSMRERFPRKMLLQLGNMIEIPALPGGLKPRAQRSYVVWIGNFRFIKNLGLLNRLARRLPEIEFRVAGHEAENPDPETSAALASLKCLSNVRFLGYLNRAQVFSLLADAAALLCTSRSEGFPNTFLEAFATGTPVITPAGVDPNSMIALNKLGFTFSDETGAAESLRRLWTMPSGEFNEFATRCRDYVVANHSPATVSARLVPALERLVREFEERHK